MTVTTVTTQSSLKAPFDLDVIWPQHSNTPQALGQTTQADPDGQSIRGDTPESYERLLPAACKNKEECTFAVPKGDIAWLRGQFDLERLEIVERYLWLAGRPVPPRPLLDQKSRGREIEVTYEIDMHLVWEPKRIYLRPLPRYIFSEIFWKKLVDHLDEDCFSITKQSEGKKGRGKRSSEADNGTCVHDRLYATVIGFLHSYVALVPEELDFRIAQSAGLLPAELSWLTWRLFVCKFLERNNHNLKNVHARFFHGELRLSRLNKIYNFILWNWRGYRYRYQSYGDFVCYYLGSIAAFTGYVVVALAAMQVGLANHFLQDNLSFQHATYQFTVFSILAPLALLVFVLMACVSLVLANLYSTRKCKRKREEEWRKAGEV